MPSDFLEHLPDPQFVSLLGVGFLLGLRHALDRTILQLSRRCLLSGRRFWLPAPSDSVGALDTRSRCLLVGSIVLVWGIRIPDEFELLPNRGVAVLLIVLGWIWLSSCTVNGGICTAIVMRANRISISTATNGRSDHRHRHWMVRVDPPTLHRHGARIGRISGVMLMILANDEGVADGLLSILVFGLGSIIGMMVIGLTISVPVICSCSISQRLFGGTRFCQPRQSLSGSVDVGEVGPLDVGH